MTMTIPDDVRELMAECRSVGGFADDADVLRAALKLMAAQLEDLDALRTAIAEWEAGDEGLPLHEAFEEVRRATIQSPPA